MKRLPLSKQIAFSIGQLGWSLLSGIIASWLVYFYLPPAGAGLSAFIYQGAVFAGLTIIGLITASGRLFDAVTDPLLAWMSDKSTHPKGRRIPFLLYSALPVSLFTFLIFMTPVNGISGWNVAWLFITLLIYYFCITAYVTPYNALIPELGKTQKDRLNLSTFISLTFIVGTAIAYIAPMLWEPLVKSGMEKAPAMRLIFGGLCIFALVCLLVPVLAIREKEYVDQAPVVSASAVKSLAKTFANRDFRIFVGSDILYWIALTLFQTGLPYYVTVLLGLEESMSGTLFVAMTAASLLFYIPINLLAKRFNKKILINIAFVLFTMTFLFTAFSGSLIPMPRLSQGFALVLFAALPLAIFGILPQAVVADISQYDKTLTGENREGMFYAARTFAFKLGQMIAMLVFTSFLLLGKSAENDLGVRVTAGTAALFCFLGFMAFLLFNEKKIMKVITAPKDGSPQ